MTLIMRILAGATSLYMLLCFVRIVLSWIDGPRIGKPYEVLVSVVDPYLDWFRRFPILKTGSVDFSPVVALASLALANNVFGTIAYYGRITVGILLSMIIGAAWSAVGFVLSFLIVAIAVRFVAYLLHRNSFSPLWRTIDNLTQPVLYRINRLAYGDRLVSYQQGMATSLAILIAARLAGGALIGLLTTLLRRLPI